jgi:hypothetical protein
VHFIPSESKHSSGDEELVGPGIITKPSNNPGPKGSFNNIVVVLTIYLEYKRTRE